MGRRPSRPAAACARNSVGGSARRLPRPSKLYEDSPKLRAFPQHMWVLKNEVHFYPQESAA